MWAHATHGTTISQRRAKSCPSGQTTSDSLSPCLRIGYKLTRTQRSHSREYYWPQLRDAHRDIEAISSQVASLLHMPKEDRRSHAKSHTAIDHDRFAQGLRRGKTVDHLLIYGNGRVGSFVLDAKLRTPKMWKGGNVSGQKAKRKNASKSESTRSVHCRRKTRETNHEVDCHAQVDCSGWVRDGIRWGWNRWGWGRRWGRG